MRIWNIGDQRILEWTEMTLIRCYPTYTTAFSPKLSSPTLIWSRTPTSMYMETVQPRFWDEDDLKVKCAHLSCCLFDFHPTEFVPWLQCVCSISSPSGLPTPNIPQWDSHRPQMESCAQDRMKEKARLVICYEWTSIHITSSMKVCSLSSFHFFLTNKICILPSCNTTVCPSRAVRRCSSGGWAGSGGTPTVIPHRGSYYNPPRYFVHYKRIRGAPAGRLENAGEQRLVGAFLLL